jgi:hypothetical protein
MAHHELLVVAIAEKIGSTRVELTESWWKTVQNLFNKRRMCQVIILAEFGEGFLEYFFLWIEDGYGRRAFEVHDRIEWWMAQICARYSNYAHYFPKDSFIYYVTLQSTIVLAEHVRTVVRPIPVVDPIEDSLIIGGSVICFPDPG